MNVYAIYDKASEIYAQPMFLVNDAVAIRTFRGAISPGTYLYNSPDDFYLQKLAEFNETEGIFYNFDTEEIIAHATEFVKQEKGESFEG